MIPIDTVTRERLIADLESVRSAVDAEMYARAVARALLVIARVMVWRYIDDNAPNQAERTQS